MSLGQTKFETELPVRPDDIDMNQHVHGSRYFDYVLAARYEQMERCYKMSMEEFIRAGFGWFIRTAHVEYKRPLRLGDLLLVRTWVEEMFKDGVRVQFEIIRKTTGKLSSDGYFDYTMVSLKTGRAEIIPEWIVAKYSIQRLESAKELKAAAGFLITNHARKHIMTLPRTIRKRNVYEEDARFRDIPAASNSIR